MTLIFVTLQYSQNRISLMDYFELRNNNIRDVPLRVHSQLSKISENSTELFCEIVGPAALPA